MRIEDVMTRRVVACRTDTDLAHVARLMWENDCGAVPVVDAEDHVIGIVTDRDVCMSAHFQGKALRELKAAACMASPVATCRPGDSCTDVVSVMSERRVRRVPVTDEGGRLLGLVSMGDLFHAAQGGEKNKKSLQSLLLDALTRITGRPSRDEVAAPLPVKKGAKSNADAAPKEAKESAKKRAPKS